LKTAEKYGAVSMHHLEDEGKNLLPAVSRLIMYLRNSENKGHIAHFKALGRSAWQDFDNALNIIETARKENLRITCDFFPYTSTGSNLSSFLPQWVLSENRNKILALLAEEKTRQNLIEYLKGLTLHYEKIIIASTVENSASLGKNIRQISLDSGLREEEVIIDLLKSNDLRVAIFNNVILDKNIEILAGKPYSMVASDGVGYDVSYLDNTLPHPRSFGSFPRIFSEFIRQKKLLNWENAVYKMSGLPAEILGIKKRGALAKGKYADIVIFNPNTIKDNATYDNPFQYPTGIEYVFINGTLTFAENKMTEKSNGKVLKKNNE